MKRFVRAVPPKHAYTVPAAVSKKPKVGQAFAPGAGDEFVSLRRPLAPTRGDPLRCLSWNLNGLAPRVNDGGWAEFADFVAVQKPDVICLQEVRLVADGPANAKRFDGGPRNRSVFRRSDAAAAAEAEAADKALRLSPFEKYDSFLSLSDWRYGGTLVLVEKHLDVRSVRFNLDWNQREETLDTAAAVHHPDGRIVLLEFDTFLFLATYSCNNGSSEKSFARRRLWDAECLEFLLSINRAIGFVPDLATPPRSPTAPDAGDAPFEFFDTDEAPGAAEAPAPAAAESAAGAAPAAGATSRPTTASPAAVSPGPSPPPTPPVGQVTGEGLERGSDTAEGSAAAATPPAFPGEKNAKAVLASSAERAEGEAARIARTDPPAAAHDDGDDVEEVVAVSGRGAAEASPTQDGTADARAGSGVSPGSSTAASPTLFSLEQAKLSQVRGESPVALRDASLVARGTAVRCSANVYCAPLEAPPPGKPVVWMGDLNCAPHDFDLTHPEWFKAQNSRDEKGHRRPGEFIGQPGCTPAERRQFREYLTAGGLADAYRSLHPRTAPDTEGPYFSWRGTRGVTVEERGRYFAKGMRIDHALVHRRLQSRVRRCEITGHGAQRVGFFGSDHCPIVLDLHPADASTGSAPRDSRSAPVLADITEEKAESGAAAS